MHLISACKIRIYSNGGVDTIFSEDEEWGGVIFGKPLLMIFVCV